MSARDEALAIAEYAVAELPRVQAENERLRKLVDDARPLIEQYRGEFYEGYAVGCDAWLSAAKKGTG